MFFPLFLCKAVCAVLPCFFQVLFHDSPQAWIGLIKIEQLVGRAEDYFQHTFWNLTSYLEILGCTTDLNSPANLKFILKKPEHKSRVANNVSLLAKKESKRGTSLLKKSWHRLSTRLRGTLIRKSYRVEDTYLRNRSWKLIYIMHS